MKESTRRRKESLMLKAAGRIIQKKGLTNFTMEEVAEEAYVTKVTLYTYFTSKENLTMAVSHSIYKELLDRIQEVSNSTKGHKGLDCCIGVKSEILNFISERPSRAVVILEFLAIYNMPKNKLSNAMANSPYRLELNKDTQKLATVINGYIEKGKKDGSILNRSETEILFFYIWNSISGFIALASTPEFQETEAPVNLQTLVSFHEKSVRQILSR